MLLVCLSVKLWCYWLWRLVMSLVCFDPDLSLNSYLFLVKLLVVLSFSRSKFCFSLSISCLYGAGNSSLWFSGVCSNLVNHPSKVSRWWYMLNSSPTDELGHWCLQSWWSQAMLLQEKEVSMATLWVAPTQTESPWCLKREEPANRGEMEPPTPRTPSTKLQQLRQNTRQYTYQRNVADSENDTINSSARPGQFGTQLGCNVKGTVNNKWDPQTQFNDTGCQASWLEMPARASEGVRI